MSAALNIASRALVANQSVLQVVGHNIANANTVGYSRQTANLTVSGYQQYANGFFGKGVEVGTVTRAYDAYLTREAQASKSVAAADAIRLSRLEQLEAAFPMGEAGLGEALNSMLNAWADVASSPSNQTARLVVIARADAFAARMRDTAQQLDMLGESTELQIGEVVTNVNRLAAELAKVNQKLTEFAGSSNTPNDLLDQRDQLLSDISRYVQISSVAATAAWSASSSAAACRWCSGRSPTAWWPAATRTTPPSCRSGSCKAAQPRCCPTAAWAASWAA